jgi:hypothetical protein
MQSTNWYSSLRNFLTDSEWKLVIINTYTVYLSRGRNFMFTSIKYVYR